MQEVAGGAQLGSAHGGLAARAWLQGAGLMATTKELIAKGREGIKPGREDARADLAGDFERGALVSFFDGLEALCALCERQDARIVELEERVLILRRRLGR